MRHRNVDTTTLENVMGALKHCSHLRWIEPRESWQSNERRFHTRKGYVTVSTDPYRSEWVETPPNPELPVEFSQSYGDWKESANDRTDKDGGDWILPEYGSGSDYSGDLVNVANYRVLREQCEAAFPETEGSDYLTYYGGHGTYAIAIRVAALVAPDEDDPGFKTALVETIVALEDYPVADEDLHSELEMESQNEAWADWACGDFKTALGKYLANSEDERLNEFAADADWISDEQASDWFRELSEYANEYWVNESGDGSYIDVERVVKNGFTREMHWPEGTAKRAVLYAEITATLQSAGTAAMLMGEL